MSLAVDSTPAVVSATRGLRSRVRGKNLPGAVLALLWLAIVVVPVYWVVITSVSSVEEQFRSTNPLVPPSNPTLDNFGLAIGGGFARYFLNSTIVVLGTVALVLAVSFLAAYTITRSRWGFGRSSFSIFLVGLAFPAQAAVIPVFYIINRMRLYDTLLAVILVSAAFAVPITVIILVNFLRDIPSELFESMRVDGAGNWRIMWSLVLPLSRPALVTVGIYDGLQAWNGFLFPLVLTQDPDIRVIPLGLYSFAQDLTLNIPAMMAAVVLSALPILILYTIGRRQLLAGLTAGFGK